MKLYLIGGLGADSRVFDYLQLDSETQVIDWIKPVRNESLADYVSRLKKQIDTEQDFGLLGVSFGGLIAVELAKQIESSKLILISSVEIADQLPRKFVWIGKTGVLKLIPDALIRPPRFIQSYLFGAKDKKLLNKIIQDTEPSFIRWALNIMLNWKNRSNSIKPTRIHGTKDRLIPLVGNAITVEGGAHFMIVDKAAEISAIVNRFLAE